MVTSTFRASVPAGIFSVILVSSTSMAMEKEGVDKGGCLSSVPASSFSEPTARPEEILKEAADNNLPLLKSGQFHLLLDIDAEGKVTDNTAPLKVFKGKDGHVYGFFPMDSFACPAELLSQLEDRSEEMDYIALLSAKVAGVDPNAFKTVGLRSVHLTAHPWLSQEPIASTNVHICGILDATAKLGTSKRIDFDVIDSMGLHHDVTALFSRTEWTSSVWGVRMTSKDASDIAPPYKTGISIKFNNNGLPVSFDGKEEAPVLGITWKNGAQPSSIKVNLGAVGQANGIRAVGTSFDFRLPQTDGRGLARYVTTISTHKYG